jgi:hypothetical protein
MKSKNEAQVQLLSVSCHNGVMFYTSQGLATERTISQEKHGVTLILWPGVGVKVISPRREDPIIIVSSANILTMVMEPGDLSA